MSGVVFQPILYGKCYRNPQKGADYDLLLMGKLYCLGMFVTVYETHNIISRKEPFLIH